MYIIYLVGMNENGSLVEYYMFKLLSYRVHLMTQGFMIMLQCYTQFVLTQPASHVDQKQTCMSSMFNVLESHNCWIKWMLLMKQRQVHICVHVLVHVCMYYGWTWFGMYPNSTFLYNLFYGSVYPLVILFKKQVNIQTSSSELEYAHLNIKLLNYLNLHWVSHSFKMTMIALVMNEHSKQ
jgi:hypothetical protein